LRLLHRQLDLQFYSRVFICAPAEPHSNEASHIMFSPFFVE
jgi:hypothetical protein